MENQLLRDSNIYPSEEVLEEELKDKYIFYKELMNKINEENLSIEWRYYNDGKSWLCKVTKGKKTVSWISIWDVGTKTTFFFNEKTINGVQELEISNDIKNMLNDIKPTGKLFPILFCIDCKKSLDDALEIIRYKSELK